MNFPAFKAEDKLQKVEEDSSLDEKSITDENKTSTKKKKKKVKTRKGVIDTIKSKFSKE